MMVVQTRSEVVKSVKTLYILTVECTRFVHALGRGLEERLDFLLLVHSTYAQ